MQEGEGGGGFYRVRKHVALFSFSAVDFFWDKNKAAIESDIQCGVTLCGPLIIEKSPAAASAPSGSGGKS